MKSFILLALLVLPAVILTFDNGKFLFINLRFFFDEKSLTQGELRGKIFILGFYVNLIIFLINKGSNYHCMCDCEDLERTYVVGHKMMSYAEEDPLEEDDVEVEGEADVEEVTTTDEEEEEDKTTASPDADTTLLFVRPIATAGQLGIIFIILNVKLTMR